MKFSFAAFFTTVGLVVLSGIASLIEGTFTSRKVTMGFVNHGGMWGDLILMSTVIGLVFPYLTTSPRILTASLVLAVAVTGLAHHQWANWMRNDGITGHMFRNRESAVWYLQLTTAGWMHVIVMVFLLMALSMYAASPTPVAVVITASIILSLHLFAGTVQPGWYCTGKLCTWKTVAGALPALALIWSVAFAKIRFGNGRF